MVEPDDVIEVRQVRHYDLDVVRRPKTQVYGVPDPVYSKTILFDTMGALERRTEQFDADGFVRYVEETFVQCVPSHGVMRPGENVVVGLSGGRDTVAYLTLLERTRDRIPPIEMTAVTITGLPDWEEPATFAAARESGRAPGRPPGDRHRRGRGAGVPAARPVRGRDERGGRRARATT